MLRSCEKIVNKLKNFQRRKHEKVFCFDVGVGFICSCNGKRAGKLVRAV
jgi:hypothetical protein